MPAFLRRRALAAMAGILVAAGLTGCAAASYEQDPTGPRVAAQERPADVHYAAARLVDDTRNASLLALPRKPNGALVVFLHGSGQTRWSLVSRRSEGRVANALSEAGFTILSADALGRAWGDPASVRDYRTLIQGAQRRYRLKDVFLMGESMGGLATMQLARTLPDVRAVTAWFPVCDLRTMVRTPRFAPYIRSAWRGRARTAVSPVRVGDLPMTIWASPQDTVVDASKNAALCVREGRAAGASVTYIQTTGEHGDPSNYDPAAVVAFFTRYRTPGV